MTINVKRTFTLTGDRAGKDLVLPLVGISFIDGTHTFSGPRDQADNLAKYLSDGYAAKWADASPDAADDTQRLPLPGEVFSSISAPDDPTRTNAADVRTVGTQLQDAAAVDARSSEVVTNVAGADPAFIDRPSQGGGGLPGADPKDINVPNKADMGTGVLPAAGSPGGVTAARSGEDTASGAVKAATTQQLADGVDPKEQGSVEANKAAAQGSADADPKAAQGTSGLKPKGK